MIDRLLFPQRVQPGGQVVPKGWRTRLYQRIVERGWTPPWCMSHAACQAYWQVPAGLTDRIDRPEDYATGPVGVMPHVMRAIEPHIAKDEPILEIGCNAGSKLNELLRAGYTNLAGLELNPACFSVMEQSFPSLHQSLKSYCGAAEDVLPAAPDRAFALVFSVSSLSLIHPSRHYVFEHIARVCGKALLTVEIEWAAGRHFFPRDYRRIFERLGFSQVSSMLLTRDACPQPELAAYWGHVMRMFLRQPGR